MRDASHFPEPDQFNPSRFLDDKGCVNNDIPHDPSKLVFGFGRRYDLSPILPPLSNNDIPSICPGRYLADEMGPFMVLALLWAFTIEGVDGPTSLDEVKWTNSNIWYVKYI